MEERVSRVDATKNQREAAERFWHLGRGLKAAFVLAFFVVVFGLAFHHTAYDVYLDADLGSQIVRGGLGSVNESALGVPGAPRSGWLWWLVTYVLVDAWGGVAVPFAAAVLVAGGFGVLLVALGRRINIVVAGLVLLLAAYIIRPNLAPCCEAAGVFVFGALAALLAGGITGNGRRLWWAVPLMLLYVNIDLSWPAGAGLCVGFAAIAVFTKVPARGRKIAVAVLALAVTLVNPDFLGAWRVAWRLPVEAGSAYGFLSPLVSAAVVNKSAALVVFGVGVVVALAAAGKVAIAFMTAAAVMMPMGLSVGNAPVFVLCSSAGLVAGLSSLLQKLPGLLKGTQDQVFSKWVGPVLLEGLETWQVETRQDAGAPPDPDGDERGDWRWLRVVYGTRAAVYLCGIALLVAFFVASVGTSGIYRCARDAGGAGLPRRAVSFISERGLSGLALVHPAWAGYLQWRTSDRVRAVADSRPLSASREASETALWAFGGAGGFRSAGEFLRKLNKWGVSFALVPQEWARAGDFRKTWIPIYWDDMSTVLVPNIPENADLIALYDTSATYPPFFNGNLRGERLRQVMKRLEERIGRDGDSAYAFYELGVCCFLLKDYDRAEKSLGLAIMTKADFAAAYHLLADIHRLRGDDQKAIDLYRLAVKFKPDLAMAYLQMGNLFFKQGDWQRGVANLKAAQAADDAWPQLDRIAPGLRKQLDEKVKEATTPRQHPKPGPDTHQPPGSQKPGKSIPGSGADAGAAAGGA